MGGGVTSVPDRIRQLVLYEAAWPRVVGKEALARLKALAQAGDWEGFAVTFFHERLSVPLEELGALRTTELWPPIIADAQASLGDLRALSRYDFQAERFRELRVPVLLQIGTESPRDLYVTDALAAVLPDARIEALPGQAHEGMTTAPKMSALETKRAIADHLGLPLAKLSPAQLDALNALLGTTLAKPTVWEDVRQHLEPLDRG